MIRLSELKLPLAELPVEHRRAADAPAETDADRVPPPHPLPAVKALAAQTLGVDETQVIHMALHELASKVLPQYEADEGALTPAQWKSLKQSAPKAKGRVVRSSLFDAPQV